MAAILISCSGGSTPTTDTAGFLPQSLNESALIRSSEVSVFVGDSLFNYINGGAEVYHQYGFVEVATAYYKLGEQELIADIYLFDTSVNAYGMYTMLRPDDPDIIKLGVTGHRSETSLEFVKSKFMVKLTNYDESDEIIEARNNLADHLNGTLPGETDRPLMLSYFPDKNVLPNSDRYDRQAFLGQIFLTDIFSQRYMIDQDTVTLYLADDPTGTKMADWLAKAESKEIPAGLINNSTFGVKELLLIENDYYGDILAVTKSPYLAGIINYNNNCESFFVDWLGSLPGQSQ